jgi:glycerophosphoryl diester phosphodiesterase
LFAACSEDSIIKDFANDNNTGTTGSTKSASSPTSVGNNVVAHRGAYKEFGLPDNSIAALQKAIELSCYASECDIHLTKDKKVVIYHDDTFHGLAFNNATYAELKAAGKLSNGETLPLLEDLLDVILAAGTTRLWVDVKSLSDTYGGNEWSSQAGEKAAEVVRAKGARNFVEFIVGKYAVLKRCLTAVNGDWQCGYMNTEFTPEKFVNEGLKWANFTVSAFYPNNPSLIQEFKNKGIKVSCYNADNTTNMTWFNNKDLYCVCTNYPQKLINLMKQNNRTVHGIELKLVEGGTFRIGANPGEIGYQSNGYNSPAHEVTLSDYYIGKYEITQQQYMDLIGGDNPSQWPWNTYKRSDNDHYKPSDSGTNKYASYPADKITWDMAQNFISLLNQQSGVKGVFSLPTEAEWEYAARGGKLTKEESPSNRYLYSGHNIAANVGLTGAGSSTPTESQRTVKIGLYEPNELGIYDMTGNVMEWVYDYFEAYTSGAQTNPSGPSSGSNNHVFRGGSWWHAPYTVYQRAYNANANYTGNGLLGFRVVYKPD